MPQDIDTYCLQLVEKYRPYAEKDRPYTFGFMDEITTKNSIACAILEVEGIIEALEKEYCNSEDALQYSTINFYKQALLKLNDKL